MVRSVWQQKAAGMLSDTELTIVDEWILISDTFKPVQFVV